MAQCQSQAHPQVSQNVNELLWMERWTHTNALFPLTPARQPALWNGVRGKTNDKNNNINHHNKGNDLLRPFQFYLSHPKDHNTPPPPGQFHSPQGTWTVVVVTKPNLHPFPPGRGVGCGWRVNGREGGPGTASIRADESSSPSMTIATHPKNAQCRATEERKSASQWGHQRLLKKEQMMSSSLVNTLQTLCHFNILGWNWRNMLRKEEG